MPQEELRDPIIQAQEVVNTAYIGYEAALGSLANELPEVEKDRGLIGEAAKTLVAEFGIQPNLFQDQAHVLFFTAIAQRFGRLEASKADLEVGVYTREKEFIGDAVTLLALDKSDHFESTKELIDSDEVASSNVDRTNVYERFTNKEVSAELREAIDQKGLLDGVRLRLGITPDNEDSFEVRVLNIGSDITAFGMMPIISDELSSKNYNDPAWAEHFADFEAYKTWEAGFVKNGDRFKSELNMEGSIPMAWMTVIDGKKTLNIPIAFAEKMLHKDDVVNHQYDEAENARDVAVLEHEYTHTQGGLILDNDVYFGTPFEERRAEWFSNDRQGYQDIKGFFLDFIHVTGVNIFKMLEAHPKGGEASEFYTELASKIGLQRVLEVAIMPPRAYVDDTRQIQKHVAENLGSFDNITKALYADMVKQGKEGEVNARLDEWAQSLLDKPHDFWIEHRKGAFGLNFITDKLVTRLDSLKTTQKAETA